MWFVLGLILGLNATGLIDIDLFFAGWWTLFIIVPCFIGLFTDNDKTGDTVGIAVGVILLLCCQDILNFDILWKLLLPIILIIIGLSFIFKETLNRDLSKKIGFHVENKQISIAYNSYVYDINEMTYLGIADILYRMSIKIPTKQEFIINTAKDLFVSGEYLLGYTSVNEYAKKAIYRATVLWDELEKANYIGKEEQPNYLDYINKLN